MFILKHGDFTCTCFLSALLYASFLYGRLFTLKISFLFSFIKRLSFLYEITVKGETHHSASLHFCAFGLLECIVNNQRNKGTWEEKRGPQVQRMNWQCTQCRCNVFIPWKSTLGLMWSMRILQLRSQLGGWTCLGGLSLPGNWAGPGPEAAVLPGKCMGSLNNIYASIKDLQKFNWGPTLNCMRLHLLGPFLQTE